MNRYDFVYFFDVTDGNPNGDPDAGNLPRVDPETGQGLVTDVCLKRKIRNFVGVVHGEQPPHEIYVKERAVLNAQHDRAWQVVSPDTKPADRKKLPKDLQKARDLTAWMCKNFFDIRAFGAVMSTTVNCGQVRGPVQFSFARSLEPIISSEHAITRCAVTRQEDFDKEDKDREMGRKFTIPYALYRVHGFINPFLADGEKGTGFSDDDLTLLKTALNQMFEYDRSAARGQMAPRVCVAFKHDSQLGNARADQLFDRVTCKRKTADDDSPARNFGDYEIAVDEKGLPEGVTVEHWV
ncbi:MAG: hypothetical protein BIFFINMI_01849 [Phycisphaerae bacterium]|nr:hypothetical protein [Phycisphaerae bacterium]